MGASTSNSNTDNPNRSWPARGHFGLEEKATAMRLFDESIAGGHVFGYNCVQEQAFCREFADFLGGGYADGVNSGTLDHCHTMNLQKNRFLL